MKSKAEPILSARSGRSAAFTLMELLVALAFMGVVIPVIYHGLHVAALAGEVSQRKELAARIGERVMNEAIVNGQNQYNSAGNEQSGGYQFHWQMTDKPWDQLTTMVASSTPTGINQNNVNQGVIHQVSVDVSFQAQGKNFGVHLSTLVNLSQQ